MCSAGGLIAVIAQRSATIEGLAVTEGNGGARGRTRRPARLPPRHRSTADRRLGTYQIRRHTLGLPSGWIDGCEADVVAALNEMAGFAPGPAGLSVLTPWHHDGHPDHDAVGRAAAEVCRAYRLRHVRYLTAAWRRDDPTDPPRHRLHCLQLSPLVRARKLRAVPPPLRSEGQMGDRELLFTVAAGAPRA